MGSTGLATSSRFPAPPTNRTSPCSSLGVERPPAKREVVGPNPARGTNLETTTAPRVLCSCLSHDDISSTISPGTYHTAGASDCYWARLSSLTTSDIIDNNTGSGPQTVQIMPTDKAFQVSGSCTFGRVG